LTSQRGERLKAALLSTLNMLRPDLSRYAAQPTVALRAYIGMVKVMVSRGELMPADGQLLIDRAERIIRAIKTP
jgi:hypothetical protein